MSIDWMSKVFNRAEPKGTNRLVLLVLADRSDELGRCWPGIHYIAKRAGVSDRTVQRCLRELESKGWIETRVGEGYGERPDRKTSIYQLRGDTGVTPSGSNGVTNQVNGVTNQVERGDTGVTLSVSDTSKIRQGGAKPPSATPSLVEWLEYAKEIGYSDVEDATGAWDSYEATRTARGWRQSNGKVITNWRAACRTCRSHSARWRRGSAKADGGWPAKNLRGAAAAEPEFNPENENAHTGGSVEAEPVGVGFGIDFNPGA